LSIQLQLRKGNSLSHSTFTGALAEITVDTNKKTVVVHDGATAGGFPLALKTDISNISGNISSLTTTSISEGNNLYFTNARVYSNVTQLGYITSSSLTGYATTANLNLKANITDLTTSNVTEGINLYFTNTRVYSNVVSIGYATNSNVALKANITDLNTSNITEGSNLYFTNARVYSNVTQLGYITSSSLSGYATNSQLNDYATNSNVALKANVADLNTSNITEGSNLYFTNARVYSNVTQLGYITSSSLTGYATNSQLNDYATNSNVALKANVADLNTSNITEGSNLYFTNARSREAISVAGAGSYNNSTGIITITGGVTSVNGQVGAVVLSTANIAESGNLYFTNARVYSNVTQLGYITSSSLTGYATNSQLSSYATTSYVSNEVANLINSAPATLDTLRELAEALGNDASFSTTITNSLALKANSSDLTTANVVENTNLYFTNTRVYSNVTQLGYITSSSLTGYATNSQLNDYATIASLALKANTADLTTANVVENTNLYFTNARVYSNVTQLGYITSSSLSGYATNSQLNDYATNSNVALKANVADLTTANVIEVNNLYFTNTRVYSNVTQLGYITSSSLTGYATNSQLNDYATTANLNLKANIVDLTTANMVENTNLYFSNTRVYSNVIQLGYITSSSLSGYATNSQLNDYATIASLALKANITDLTTANVIENTNLYYTNARVYSNVISLGYATNSNVALKANITDLTTANVVENTNLYFSNTRVYSNVTQLGYITSSSLTGYATNSQLNDYATNSNVALKANITDLTTANVIENTNLYFTNARVYSNVISLGYATNSNVALKANVADLNTSNITEGSNLYFSNTRVYSNVISLGYATNSNVALKANVADLNTSNITEGSNLYFTNARAILAVYPAVTQLIVTTPVFNYNIDQYSGDNPTIYVTAGETISFDLNQGSSHPFAIRVSNGGSNYNTGLTHVATDGTISTGSSAQGKTSGKLFWKVPYSLAGSTYVYQCTNHSSMVGNIVIQKPASTLSTLDIPENTNLYYTNTRVYSNVTQLGYITSSSLSGYATNSQLNDYATTANLNLKANIVDLTTANVIEVNNLYFTNARSRTSILASNGINYNSSTGEITSGLSLQLVDTSNTATVSVANVNTIQFDSDSGFDVIDRANGIAKVQMNSTFKTWNVYGQANLVATGLDTINIIAGNYVTISTNATSSPQQIRFDTTLTAGNNITIDANGRINASVSGGSSSNTTTTLSIPSKRYVYFPTNNQTSFSGSDYFGNTLSLSTPSTVLVFYNGVVLTPGINYSSNASHIVLTSSADSNSVLTIFESGVSAGANVADLTTANVVELTNLYFTNARSREAISVAGAGSYNNSTGIITITGGVTSVNGQVGAVSLSSANIAESGNLYFTNARVVAALTAGQSITIDANGRINSTATSSGTSTITDYQVFYGNNVSLNLSETVSDAKTILVTIDGLVQIPITDYTVSGSVLTWVNSPPANSTIEVKYFGLSGGASTGFSLSTLNSFPSGDYGNVAVNSIDPFGIAIFDIYNCMDPLGSITTEDLGILT